MRLFRSGAERANFRLSYWSDSRARCQIGGSSHFGHDSGRVLFDFVLPNFQDPPFHRLELPSVQAIALDISLELSLPVGPMRLGKRETANRAAMPKAPVNKHRDLRRWVYEVWMPWQVGLQDPLSKQLGQCDFWSRLGRLVRRHHLGNLPRPCRRRFPHRRGGISPQEAFLHDHCSFYLSVKPLAR